MAEYIFTNRRFVIDYNLETYSSRLPTVETIGYDIVSDSISRTFTLNDIVFS